MAKLKYTREELLALRDANKNRPDGIPYIPGITASFSQAPLVRTTFQPAPVSSASSTVAVEESKSESLSAPTQKLG